VNYGGGLTKKKESNNSLQQYDAAIIVFELVAVGKKLSGFPTQNIEIS
jgi:hypothetical protein